MLAALARCLLPRVAPSLVLQAECSSPVQVVRSSLWPRWIRDGGPHMGCPHRVQGSPGVQAAMSAALSLRCSVPYPLALLGAWTRLRLRRRLGGTTVSKRS